MLAANLNREHSSARRRRPRPCTEQQSWHGVLSAGAQLCFPGTLFLMGLFWMTMCKAGLRIFGKAQMTVDVFAWIPTRQAYKKWKSKTKSDLFISCSLTVPPISLSNMLLEFGGSSWKWNDWCCTIIWGWIKINNFVALMLSSGILLLWLIVLNTNNLRESTC